MIFRDLTLTWSLVISLKRNEDVFLVYEQILMHLFLVIFKCLLSCFTIYLENSFIFLVRPLVFVFFVNGCFSFFFFNSRLLEVYLISHQSRFFYYVNGLP